MMSPKERRASGLKASKAAAEVRTRKAAGRTGSAETPQQATPSLVSVVGPSALLKRGQGNEAFWSNLSDDLGDPTPAIELLQKLGFGDTEEWPSSSFGPVFPEVLAQLKRAYQILTTRGFRIVDDPLNPLGDGRSWLLRCEPTDKLPNNADL